MKSAIMQLLRIYPGEERRAGFMVFYSVVATGWVSTLATLLGKVLFLSSLGEWAIPFTLILPALVLVPAILLYNRVAARLPLDKLLVASGVTLLVGVVVVRTLLGTVPEGHSPENPWNWTFAVLATLFVFLELVAVLTDIQFWSVAGEVFDPRQARRLYGVVAGGGTLAGIGTGALASAVSTYMKPGNLLFVLAAGMVVAIGCTRVLKGMMASTSGANADDIPPEPEEASPQQKSRLQLLFASPLLTILVGMSVVTTIAISLPDYQFSAALVGAFGDNDQLMLRYLGRYQMISGGLALLIQLYVSSRVMDRFGVVAATAVLPTFLGIGAVSVLLSGGALWAATIAQGAVDVFHYTISDAALAVLYLPLAASVRQRTKELLDGAVGPALRGGLGLLLLANDRFEFFPAPSWSWVVGACLVVWALMLVRVPRCYVDALTERVNRRRLDLGGPALNLADDLSHRVLARSLEHEDELQVIHALQLITQVPGRDWNPAVLRLLSHPSSEVRKAALGHLKSSGRPEAAAEVRRLFDAPEEDVRAAAIDAYCALVGPEAVPDVAPFLERDGTRTKGAAIVGLIRNGGLDGVLCAADGLKALLVSESDELRREGAHVLGAVGVQHFYQPLLELLQDPSARVRVEAVRAAGKIGAPRLVPPLIAKLDDHATAAAATEALARYGPGLEAALEAALVAPGRASAARLCLARVLQRIGSTEAAQVLTRGLDTEDSSVRAGLAQALGRLASSGRVKLDAPAVREAANREIRAIYQLDVLSSDLTDLESASLLHDTIGARRQRSFGTLFTLLAQLYPGSGVASAQRALAGGDLRKRAELVEFLDNVLTGELKDLVLPLIEGPEDRVLDTAEGQLGLKRKTAVERLEELIDGSDPWLRACALYSAGIAAERSLAGRVAEAIGAPEPLVREAALQAQARLEGGGHGEAAVQAAKPDDRGRPPRGA